MKLEVKTQNDDYSKSFINLFITFAIISFLIILSNISIKIGTISKFYEINYLCKLLKNGNSSLNFKKLSRLTNQTSNQKNWEICRDFIK